MRLKRVWIVFLALTLCLSFARAERAYRSIPPELRFTQETVRQKLNGYINLVKTKPMTANRTVTQEIGRLVDEMYQQALPYFSREPANPIAYLDVGPIISRTGESWMSFLTLAEISRNKEHLYTACDARVYDMKTGQRVYMTDLFDEESRGWNIVANQVWTQLEAAFPDLEVSVDTMDTICCREALENAPFTLGAGRLMLTYPAELIYPGKNTLLHVVIPYSKLRRYMTPEAQRQTDNSGYRMVALTFDDGGGRDNTRGALRQLRLHGAGATFFIVGNMMAKNHDILAIQQNRGYSLQTHSYTHLSEKKAKLETILEEKQKFDEEMISLIGIKPTLLRAPGGDEYHYQSPEIGYPLIHWSLVSLDDRGNTTGEIAYQVYTNVKDGDIVLLHDINQYVEAYMKIILRELDQMDYLCVTVEELFDREGIELEPGYVYYSLNTPPIAPELEASVVCVESHLPGRVG